MILLLPINPQVAAEARLVAGADGDGELPRYQSVWLYCAQQTGMHILVVEALLVAIHSA